MTLYPDLTLRPLTVEESHEWMAAADYLAARGLTGAIGDPLPQNMSAFVAAFIDQHIESFQEDIRLAAYARCQRDAEDS